MGKADHFISPGKDHLVLAHNGAPSNGVEADLVGFPLFPLAVTLVNIGRFFFHHRSDGIDQHQSSAAGSIQLAVVVLFDNFNVKAASQYPNGGFGQLGEQINAQRHIGGKEDRDMGGSLMNLLDLLGTHSGGGKHQGNTGAPGKGQKPFQS